MKRMTLDTSERYSFLADSSFHSAYILFDSRQREDAFVCLQRAALLKMQAVLTRRSGQEAKSTQIAQTFAKQFPQILFSGSRLPNLLRYLKERIDMKNEGPASDSELKRTFAEVRHFFQLCNVELGLAKPSKRHTRYRNLFRRGMRALVGRLTRTPKRAAMQIGITILLLTGVWLSLEQHWTDRTPATNSSSIPLLPPGLMGTYMGTIDPLRDKNAPVLLRRIDGTIDFDWSSHPPSPKVPLTYYSVRWEGALRVDQPGQYQINIFSDDGVRLTLDGRRLIDDWQMHGVQENIATLALQPGWHPIRLDYLQLFGRAVIRLLWTPPHGRETLIPADHLAPRSPQAE